jgi:hypothetical protein
VKAVIRTLHSPEADQLSTWQPADPECWEIFVQVLLGPEDGPDEERFGFVACNPASLAAACAGAGYVWGLERLVLPLWDYHLLERAVGGLCDECEGDGWETVATQLARYLSWEFTNSQPDAGP